LPIRLSLALLVGFILPSSGSRAGGDELLFSPAPSDLPSPWSRRPEPKEFGAAGRDSRAAQPMRPAQGVPFIDLPWDSFATDFSGNAGAAPVQRFREVPAAGASNLDQLRLGDLLLGIETQKPLDGLERFRRTDCATDDECTDNSGLPRTAPPKGLKHFRTPFLGLSISRPLH
jgi:hypothetical protein